jgi:hypothetical protein
MSEHEKHTEFLRQCILYDESARRQKLMKEIARIQLDLRCVQRAAWLMALLGVLLVAILGYGTIMVQNFLYATSHFIINLIIAVGVGIMISLLAFAGLWIVYRWKLDLRREECRQIVIKLLESRLGKPAITPLQDHHADEGHALPQLTGTTLESSTGETRPGSQS